MNTLTRLALALLLLLALCAALFLLSRGQDAGATTPARFASATDCKGCHADVYAEWFGSQHQISFTNPEVRQLSDDFRKEECMPCHLPRPVAVTGFLARTLPRRTHFDEGVNCLSCHLGADGSILAARDVPDAPCQPRRHQQFVAVDLCESCHNQHFTTDQWRQSDYGKRGIDCNHCHMPEVERKLADGSVRKGRDHVFRGAHDLAMLKQAGVFTAARDGNELVLSLHNQGAGHNFPTEERSRAVDMVYRFVQPDGSASAWQLAWRGRQPYRDETGDNTQLPAGQTATARVPIPAGAVRAEARLWYRRAPYIGDDDPKSLLLEERQVELR